MAQFDASKDWVILLPPDIPCVKKAAADLAGYIGTLAELSGGRYPREQREAGRSRVKSPAIADAFRAKLPDETPVIILNTNGEGPEKNGFAWRVNPLRVEISGESARGLCNGIYSFLSALGISWPLPGQERLPSPPANAPAAIALAAENVCEPSRCEGENPAAAPWRRFVPADKKTVKSILRKSEAFAAWAARRRYDALVLPLAAFASRKERQKIRALKEYAAEYGIALEAGGRELTALVPRGYFLLHRDYFRMEEGRRTKAHHFCPTNPGTLALIKKEGTRLFRAAGGTRVFHLWPDKGEETTWCACPTCRAFSPQEQNRIAVNAAADALAALCPDAFLVYFEKPGETGTIPERKNLVQTGRLPEENALSGRG